MTATEEQDGRSSRTWSAEFVVGGRGWAETPCSPMWDISIQTRRKGRAGLTLTQKMLARSGHPRPDWLWDLVESRWCLRTSTVLQWHLHGVTPVATVLKEPEEL